MQCGNGSGGGGRGGHLECCNSFSGLWSPMTPCSVPAAVNVQELHGSSHRYAKRKYAVATGAHADNRLVRLRSVQQINTTGPEERPRRSLAWRVAVCPQESETLSSAEVGAAVGASTGRTRSWGPLMLQGQVNSLLACLLALLACLLAHAALLPSIHARRLLCHHRSDLTRAEPMAYQ